MKSQAQSRVLILGGGFAGLACAGTLSPDRFEVTLLDRRTHFEFLPNVHELLSGVKTPDSLRLPLAATVARHGHRFLRADAVGIDPVAHEVQLDSGRTMPYDWLVVAIGGVDATYGVEGVEQHSMPFKSVQQCARIGKRLATLGKQRKPAQVVIIGGGLEGVEALGEILRRYRDSNLQITLVEARERLLPEAPASLDKYIRRLSAGHSVAIRCGAPVRRIRKRSVELADGTRLPSELTIWTGGPAPPPLLEQSDLAPAGGWAPVDACLRSKRHADVFIAGDAAEIKKTLPRQAYHGLDMGECAARTIDRIERGLRPERYRPSPKPTLVSFGDLSCILIAGRFVLAGPALALAKEAVYELVMAQLDPQPLPWRLLQSLRRGNQAGKQLLWPTLTSFDALWRQRQFTLLAG